MEFVKDHEELYDKTNKHFKDKVRKKCLFERFASKTEHSLSPSLTRLPRKCQKQN